MFLSDRFNQITFFVAFVLLFACIMYPNLVRFVWNTDVSDQDRWTRRKNEQQQKNDLFSLIPIPFSRTIRLHADECPKRIKVNRCHVFFPGILLLMFCPRSQSMLLNYYNLCICSKFDREKIVDINFVLFSSSILPLVRNTITIHHFTCLKIECIHWAIMLEAIN